MAINTTFKLYRYQLLPIRRHTSDLFDGRTTEDILLEKNQIFANSIKAGEMYRHARVDLSVDVTATSNYALIIRIAPLRSITRERQDFAVEQIENWPHVAVIILNRDTEQYIAVQDRPLAFANTDTVVNLITKATRVPLEHFGLRMHTERLFKQSYFWDTVREFAGRVTWVGFSFVTPNMSNISRTLSEELKALNKETDASKGLLEIEADPDSALKIEERNVTVRGLVEYSSQGGGDIAIKVKGLRKKIHTSTEIREVSMSGLEITAPPEQLAEILRNLLS